MRFKLPELDCASTTPEALVRATASGSVRKWARCRGASAAELALLLPFIMAILFGIIEFGFLLYDKAMITNAAREGARLGVVYRKPYFNQAQVNEIANSYCAGRTISIVGSSACSASNDAPTDTVANPPMLPRNLTVNVDYTYNSTGLLLLYQVMAGPMHLRSTAVMAYE